MDPVAVPAVQRVRPRRTRRRLRRAATRAERTGGAFFCAGALRAGAAAAGVQRGDVAALAFPGLVQTLGLGARVFRRRARLHERALGEREHDVGPDGSAAGQARGGRRGAVLRAHRGAGVRGARVVRARGGDATVGHVSRNA